MHVHIYIMYIFNYTCMEVGIYMHMDPCSFAYMCIPCHLVPSVRGTLATAMTSLIHHHSIHSFAPRPLVAQGSSLSSCVSPPSIESSADPFSFPLSARQHHLLLHSMCI